jgi:hypothetical protein
MFKIANYPNYYETYFAESECHFEGSDSVHVGGHDGHALELLLRVAKRDLASHFNLELIS